MKERLDKFIALWQQMLDAHIMEQFPGLAEKVKKEGKAHYEEVVVEEGKRFWKIIVISGGQRSSRAFIDKTTGEIFKSASWKAPAKHARGSLLADDYGMSCMTWYGPHYLRG